MTPAKRAVVAPSIFALPLGGGKGSENTPPYLRDDGGRPVKMGSIGLRNEWQKFSERFTGREVWIRRADCGLGCRCAAEYTFTNPEE